MGSCVSLPEFFKIQLNLNFENFVTFWQIKVPLILFNCNITRRSGYSVIGRTGTPFPHLQFMA